MRIQQCLPRLSRTQCVDGGDHRYTRILFDREKFTCPKTILPPPPAKLSSLIARNWLALRRILLPIGLVYSAAILTPANAAHEAAGTKGIVSSSQARPSVVEPINGNRWVVARQAVALGERVVSTVVRPANAKSEERRREESAGLAGAWFCIIVGAIQKWRGRSFWAGFGGAFVLWIVIAMITG